MIAPRNERLIAIGDIHGCLHALNALLDAIDPQPEDLIVTLGDYVDRGPNSAGVLDRLIRLSQQTRLVCLLGNHEEMMIDTYTQHRDERMWMRYGGIETMQSYGTVYSTGWRPPTAHEKFLDALGEYFETDDFVFTHAAYEAELPMEDQSDYMLRWHSLNQEVPERHCSGKPVVVGHTANPDGEILDLGHLICIDTFCYGGGYLTAMDVRSRSIWQAAADGTMR